MEFIDIAKNAKKASLEAAKLDTETKNKALKSIADNLEKHTDEIFEANKQDLENAQLLVQDGELSQSAYHRLKLDIPKMRDMIQGVRDVASLDDPIGKVMLKRELDKGLVLEKISCPIGVLGIIFEARPDVISQISSLAIKSSNAVILKGGKEAINTNKKIMEIMTNALDSVDGFPKNVIQQVFSHDDISQMLQCDKYINLIIPRGSNKLVQYIKENTKIPVLGHASGICHIFVDKSADLDTAIRIITDAKTQYPSACNSVETLLIHKDFPKIDELLASLQLSEIKLVFKPEGWDIEYGDKILAVKYVENIDEAIKHINTYGSGHTDCIITQDNNNAEKFMNEVDSSGVYWNASTRFADGFRYGFGAEVGISTNKTHARGPVGLEGLTIYKYKLIGNGQVVDDYVKGVKHFHHKDLPCE
ncbi:MAG TPA: glutamate-5-semialdehyde dehydrogenase [Cyanobacteria bacterium UBA11991]|nr:glutamate-5-semialdehyde dehydrogenase [Cyanobacteriota bacterium]MDY6382527.1 glutamate-5-semialdehyde dehydrogenase [Cyanobacteriota bacterium]HCB11351.1 glutamate-5-semialdehyde dehydrogenase [Cyanobacteria bacterium UBA11991]